MAPATGGVLVTGVEDLHSELVVLIAGVQPPWEGLLCVPQHALIVAPVNATDLLI